MNSKVYVRVKQALTGATPEEAIENLLAWFDEHDLMIDDEVVVYCPDCDEREFSDG